MIYYLYGSDWLRLRLAAAKLKAELATTEKKILSLSVEKETWLAELEQWCRSQALLAEPEVLVFQLEKISGAEKQRLESLFNSLTVTEKTLILLEPQPQPSLKLRQAEKIEFALPGTKQLKQWQRYLLNLATELGIELEKELVNQLLLSAELREPGYLYQELLKLSLYQPGKKLGLREFFQLNEQRELLDYFGWVEAVLRGDLAKSLMNIPPETTEGLARLRNLIHLFQLLAVSKEKNFSPRALAAKKEFLAKTNPFWLKNLTRWAQQLSSAEISLRLKKLLELEVRIKTGALTVQEGLRLFCLSQL